MPVHPFVVAIDGPAASGKSTLARRLANRFELSHLDTGALYRAVALLVLDQARNPADAVAAEEAARQVDLQLLQDPRLRGEVVSAAASVVAAIPAVRRVFLDLQRNFAAHPQPPAKGAVLDGRDIGSIVCPEADVKLFITADVAERARRRVGELRQGDAVAIFEDVLQDLTNRDARDTGRRAAPLIAPPDAVVIDTTTLDADAVFDRACVLIERALKEKEWQQ